MSQGTTPQAARPRSRAHEEGMALVLALLVLLVLTIIGAALMANVNTESKITGLKVRSTQAMQVAEAGVQEAMLRLRNGDIPDDGNPRAVTVIFNQVAGSLPAVGTDTTALPTLQPTGSYLNYSTATKNWAMLTVKYKTRGTQILRYDDTANPKVNTATGNPIWIIRSTGVQASSADTVYAEVTRARVNVLAKGAVVANVGIQVGGNIKICGHDHRSDTRLWACPGGNVAQGLECNGVYDGSVNPPGWWNVNVHSTCMPGAWSSSVIDTANGSPTVLGEPSSVQSNMSGFYSGPWDAFSMTQNDYWSWVGAPMAIPPLNPTGIIYLDNNLTKQDQSGDWIINGGNGEGFLYVDGKLHINGNFTYRGLIYVEGDLDINGNCWILGGLVVKGNTLVKIANGSAIILYSGDAITQKISKYGGNMRTIAWREL